MVQENETNNGQLSQDDPQGKSLAAINNDAGYSFEHQIWHWECRYDIVTRILYDLSWAVKKHLKTPTDQTRNALEDVLLEASNVVRLEDGDDELDETH